LDPAADKALFAAIESNFRAGADRKLVRSPLHINDPDFAELIHNDGVLFAVLFGQDTVQERRLTRAKEACKHGNGNWLGHGP
jgi:hypothetical protein